jgi:AhpD family alkylhydroperoxidase
MKALMTAVTLAALACAPAMAQDAPKFFKDTLPSYALDEAMSFRGALSGEESPLDAKTTQLIQLGVSAQIPCEYCVYAHTRGAKAAGATDEEIKAAVAAAGAIRLWSTVLNGMQYDMDAFTAEADELIPVN